MTDEEVDMYHELFGQVKVGSKWVPKNDFVEFLSPLSGLTLQKLKELNKKVEFVNFEGYSSKYEFRKCAFKFQIESNYHDVDFRRCNKMLFFQNAATELSNELNEEMVKQEKIGVSLKLTHPLIIPFRAVVPELTLRVIAFKTVFVEEKEL